MRYDKSIKIAPTIFFHLVTFSIFQSNMIGAIGFAVSGNEFRKKSIHVICEIFMKKSFVYFRTYLKDLQAGSFLIFVLSSFLKIGLTVAVLACSEYLLFDMSQSATLDEI